MGGLWGQLPKLSALTMLFAAAALGLPGLANFIGEFMILLGVFQVQPWAASLSALGMILAPVYALLILQKGFFGAPAQGQLEVLDLNSRELVMLGILALGLILLGFWPNLIFMSRFSRGCEKRWARTESLGNLHIRSKEFAKGAESAFCTDFRAHRPLVYTPCFSRVR